MKEQNNSGEIDLLKLLIETVKLFRDYWILILVCSALGVAVGYVKYVSSKKIYQSKMIISTDIYTASYSIKLFQNLNLLIGEGNYKEIGSKLGIEESDAKNMVKILIEDKADGISGTPDEIKKSSVLITLDVLDPTDLSRIQKGLVDYVANNDFAMTQVKQKKHRLSTLIKKIEEEITSLEEFKVRIYKGNFFAEAKGNVIFDPTNVNMKIIDLTDKKLQYQNSLEMITGLQIIENLTALNKPVSPRKVLMLAVGGLLGLLVSVVVITFLSLRKVMAS